MARNGNVKTMQVIEGEVITAPPSSRLRLGSIRDVRREMSKVYAEARRGDLPVADAGRLTWILQAIVGVIRESDLEERIRKLEEQELSREIT